MHRDLACNQIFEIHLEYRNKEAMLADYWCLSVTVGSEILELRCFMIGSER